MTESHPIHRLPELVSDVRLSLQVEGGAVLDGSPEPSSYREAVQWMVHRNYLRSARYKAQQWAADTAGLDPDVAEFVRVYTRHMHNIGIPVHADLAFAPRHVQARLYVLGELSATRDPRYESGRAVALCHSVRGRSLPPVCWRLFGHVGEEVANRLGLEMQWGGEREPWHWEQIVR